MVIDDQGKALWSLNVRRKWIDGFSDAAKRIVIDWWIYETRVSPNKKDVTQKRIVIGAFEKCPTHYVMSSITFFAPSFISSLVVSCFGL
jgi:hypothetical protein